MTKRYSANKDMSRKQHLEAAKRFHHDAYVMSREQGKFGVYDSKPIEYHEMAAKHYMRAKDFTRAEEEFNEAYSEALEWSKRKPGLISQKHLDRLKTNAERMYKLREGKWRIRKGKLETISEEERKAERSFISSYSLPAIIAIAGLGTGIFFLSNNITGNTIADLSSITSNSIGAVLILLGMISTFWYFRKKNLSSKKKVKKK